MGVPHIEVEKRVCGSCLLGKQPRQAFPNSTPYRATKKLEIVHGDLCGPIFVLIEDFSRYMWTVLLKDKGEAFTKFKNFKSIVEQESGS